MSWFFIFWCKNKRSSPSPLLRNQARLEMMDVGCYFSSRHVNFRLLDLSSGPNPRRPKWKKFKPILRSYYKTVKLRGSKLALWGHDAGSYLFQIFRKRPFARSSNFEFPFWFFWFFWVTYLFFKCPFLCIKFILIFIPLFSFFYLELEHG